MAADSGSPAAPDVCREELVSVVKSIKQVLLRQSRRSGLMDRVASNDCRRFGETEVARP